MIENQKAEPSTATAGSDDENGNANENEGEMLSSGTFLVRYSKKENNCVLTLLDDNDQLKNFIIKKHVSRTTSEASTYWALIISFFTSR